MIKACIFDLDGTLADTVESIAYATNRALADAGFGPLPVENYKYYAGDGAKTLVERALLDSGDSSLESFDKVYDIYCEFFKNDCTYKVTVFDGIKELIVELKALGIKVAVLSNKPHERSVDVVLSLFGEDVFDHVQGQMDAISKKPDPAGAWMTAKALGVKPEECMYIGDTNVDMQTGNSAGMYTVGVLWGFRLREELEKNHAHGLVAHPLELLELLQRKNTGMQPDTPVRLIICDVDGTLLPYGQLKFDENVIPVVNKLMAKGYIFAVASGRQVDSILTLFEGTRQPLYIIGENGGHTYFNGESIAFCSFSNDDYKEILQAVRSYDQTCRFVIAGQKEYYTDCKDDAFIKEMTEEYLFKMQVIDDLTLLQQPVCKIAIYLEGDAREFSTHFQEVCGDKYDIAVSGTCWVDFNPKGVNKGSAVTALQTLLNVSPETTMIFGDNENDVSMLSCAKYSCVVSEGHPSARRAAAYETDCVIKDLEKLL